MSGSGPIAGGVFVTVMVPVPVPVLPAASVAVQVTVVAPTGNEPPDVAEQETGRLPSVSSVADAEKLTGVVGPVATTVLLSTVTTGGVVSAGLTQCFWAVADWSPPLTSLKLALIVSSPTPLVSRYVKE